MLMLQHTCTVTRNVTTGTNGRRTPQQLATGVRCLALPLAAAAALRNGFDTGRGYDFFFSPDADIKVKDTLTVGDKDYTVSAVLPYNVSLVGHLHVLAQQEIGS